MFVLVQDADDMITSTTETMVINGYWKPLTSSPKTGGLQAAMSAPKTLD